MVSVTLLDHPFSQFNDDNGTPLSGGLIETYNSGTPTHRQCYTDGGGTVQHPFPIQLDAYGRAVIYVEDVAYKFIVKKSDGTLVRTVDPVRVALPADVVTLTIPAWMEPLVY